MRCRFHQSYPVWIENGECVWGGVTGILQHFYRFQQHISAGACRWNSLIVPEFSSGMHRPHVRPLVVSRLLLRGCVMSRWVLTCCCLLFAYPVLAADCVTSETSHAIGGALIAGVVTGTVADTYWPEHRALVGFATSTSVILISEGFQVADGARVSSSLLDVGSHMIGALIGATITDRYVLAPVVERKAAGNARVGIVMRQNF